MNQIQYINKEKDAYKRERREKRPYKRERHAQKDEPRGTTAKRQCKIKRIKKAYRTHERKQAASQRR